MTPTPDWDREDKRREVSMRPECAMRQGEMAARIALLESQCVDKHARIRALEAWQNKAIGMAAAISAAMSYAVSILTEHLK